MRRTDGSTVDFNTHLKETFTDSLVVVKDGKVFCERHFNGMTADQPHIMMSCTKSFIGLFALQAVEAGYLSEDDRVGDLLPEVDNGGAFSDATFGQVLDMTSSISFNEEYNDPAADIHDYVWILGLGSETGRFVQVDNLYDYLPALRKNEELDHGEVLHYQTPKTDLVNWINSRLTNRSLLESFEGLWARMGTAGEAYLVLDPAAVPVAG